MSHFRHSFVKKKTAIHQPFGLCYVHTNHTFCMSMKIIFTHTFRVDQIRSGGRGEPDVCRSSRRKSVFSLPGIARPLRPAISPVFPSQLLMAVWPHTHFGLLARQIAAAGSGTRWKIVFLQRSITSLEHALTHLLLMFETTLKNLCVVVWELVYTNKHQPPSSYRLLVGAFGP